MQRHSSSRSEDLVRSASDSELAEETSGPIMRRPPVLNLPQEEAKSSSELSCPELSKQVIGTKRSVKSARSVPCNPQAKLTSSEEAGSSNSYEAISSQ